MTRRWNQHYTSRMPTLKLSDDRFLEYFDNGISSTRAIIFHHGTPGHASTWASWLEPAASRGIRAISYSRAGYGISDRNEGRTVASNNEDIRALLDSFGITEFISIGWSGGGPHALATSKMDGNNGVITLAGVGAYGVDDLDFLAGMGPENEEEFGEALKGESAISAWMDTNAGAFKNVTGDQIRESFGGLIGDADKGVLEGAFADELASTFRKGLAVSFDGWIDDDVAFVQPWGFELSAISVPALIWQGDQDLMVPHAHSYWLEKHISSAQLNFVPGHGHISLLVKYRDQILDQAAELLN
ncbi:MAG: alpha/beta fold hydrolase [Actinobacteria bacterium]|nr:alpha/beta fold hydrolase [Actinomycetota bacterium]